MTFTLRPEGAALVAGAAAPSILFEVSVDANATHGSVLTNTATVSSATRDSTPGNDTDGADLTIAREVDLSVAKSHDAEDGVVAGTIDEGLDVGEQITLTVRVRIGAGAYPAVTNVATVDSPTEQTDDARLVDDATVDVAAADPLATTGAEVAWGLLLAALLTLAAGVALIRRSKASAGTTRRAE